MATSSRDELLHNAVLFLLDPKVKESSLTSRITFLENKGLSEAEIQEALRKADSQSSRAGSGSSYSSTSRAARSVPDGYGGQVRFAQEPPAFPRRDWRDVFVSIRSVL